MVLVKEYTNRSVEYVESPETDIWLIYGYLIYEKDETLEHWKKVAFSTIMLGKLDN